MTTGTDTLTLTKNDVEVVHISPFGLWLFSGDSEFFVSFTDYPALLHATIHQLNAVTVDSFGDFHWAELDVDIERDALQTPEKYPLYFKA